MAASFHSDYLTLIETLERRFPVSQWMCGDVEVWPLARMDLYLDMYWAQAGCAPPALRPWALRALGRLATPLTNLWKSRHDLRKWIALPHRAHAIFLGDGVSLDLIGQAWQDRFCEPLVAELEGCGLKTFLMQGGELARLPWHRPTFSANQLGAWGMLTAGAAPRAEMPEHEALMRLLADHGVRAPSLEYTMLERRARVVYATAVAFEWVLRKVRPTLAFVVTFYAGLGAAFLVACRRQRVLSIDLQHCPQEGAHKAYGWKQLPPMGYATLPAIFWTWTEQDAAYIRGWSAQLQRPWHRSVHGGHTQLAGWARQTPDHEQSQDTSGFYQREILLALQPIGAPRGFSQALRSQIEKSPRQWRWWIRCHPASTAEQNRAYKELLTLDLPNVTVDAASAQTLPALLRRVHALVSLSSGAAAEAAAFGVAAFFLSEQARAPFAALIERGQARILEVEKLNEAIAQLPSNPPRSSPSHAPALADTLQQLTEMAHAYAHW